MSSSEAVEMVRMVDLPPSCDPQRHAKSLLSSADCIEIDRQGLLRSGVDRRTETIQILADEKNKYYTTIGYECTFSVVGAKGEAGTISTAPIP
jgi:hypothetical protein